MLEGPLPTGKGVLGVMIKDPRPIRIAVPGDHPASAGFPPGHPPDDVVPRSPHPGPATASTGTST